MLTESPLPSGIVTFLFTDIEGSTKMVQRLGQDFDAVLQTHNRIVRSAIEGTGGTVVRTEGDAFFAVFETPSASLEAALSAQRGLFEHGWQVGERVQVRMGMHTGEGRLGGDDYIGLEVHRAARIGAAGHGGQILVSEVTKSLLGRSLDGSVELHDLGEHQLKDLDHPERIFQVLAPDLPSDFPPLRTADTPTNLPTQHSDFVGRESEAEDIARLLGEHRLVTLTGVGGTGKTRLAIHVAASLLDRFPEGVYFVALDEVEHPDRVGSAIAAALGVTGDGEPISAVTTEVGDGSVLLLLDNFEHVVAAAPSLVTLLADCPRIAILATSQALLRVRGEQAYPVPPLGLPARSGMEAVRASDSVSLFVRRVRATDPAFELTEATGATVASIVTRLDGLPLAIELAASRVRLFGVDGLLDELRTSLADLGGGYADVPARHQTLHAAIDWSYGLLSEEERAVLRRASVFIGGFGLDAVRAVCAGGVVPDVVTALGSLLDKSLIQPHVAGGTRRFSMLETIRSYGQARLAEAGEATETERQHAAFFTGIARSASDSFRGPDSYALMERLGVDRANLIAALEWAAAHEPDLGLEAMAVLARYFQVSGTLGEGAIVAQLLLAASDATPAARLTGLLGAASISYWLLDYGSAVASYEEAVAMARDLGENSSLREALFGLAYSYLWHGRSDEAADAGRELVALAEELDDEVGASQAVMAMGGVVWVSGDVPGAARLFVDGYRRNVDLGDVASAIQTELTLVGMLILVGRHDEALPQLRHLLGRFRERNDESLIARTLDFLSRAIVHQDPRAAVRLSATVAAVTQRQGGTIPLSTFGFLEPRDVAASSLEPNELDGLWAEGGELELDEGVRLAEEWLSRQGVVAAPVDVDAIAAAVEEAALSG